MNTSRLILITALLLILVLPVMAAEPAEIEVIDDGELYGDLYVILRDENGGPILAANGCLQPISQVNDQIQIATLTGPMTVTVQVGEPFALPTFTDPAGDLVECELTEDMADWVKSVEFGRLNLGRAPERVVEHAFDEAVTKMNNATAISLDPSGRLDITLPDPETGNLVVKTIDSPAENLALYIKTMLDGHWITSQTEAVDAEIDEPRPVLNESAIILLGNLGYTHLGDNANTPANLNSHEMQLAASLLAAAADKTGSISLDMLVYINSVYGINQASTGVVGQDGKTYFNYGGFNYDRNEIYAHRHSGSCNDGSIWVLQPVPDTEYFAPVCMEIMGYENSGHDPYNNSVHFADMTEEYNTVPYSFSFLDNIRGFVQAADDALQVLEYVHNYKIPVQLYPIAPPDPVNIFFPITQTD